jgi:hypothetical protein
LGQAFPAALAGRALSAFNLLIFAGVFALQWTIGLGLDALLVMGWPVVQAYRLVFGLFIAVCTLSFLWLNVVGSLQRRFLNKAQAGG